MLAGVVVLLGVARWLEPQGLEDGTYRHWLLRPCGLLQSTGYPCPTCFMTRSFSYMMHGRVDKAFWVQPFGALLVLAVIYLGYGAVQVLVTGQPWRPVWVDWPRKYILAGILVAFLGAWIFKLLYGTFVSGQFPVGR